MSPTGGFWELRPAPQLRSGFIPRGGPTGQGLCWCSDLPSEPFFLRKILLQLLLPLEKACRAS